MVATRQQLFTYVITIATYQRYRHFQRTANAELFLATIFQHREKGRFQIHAFVVMPDHVHMLITPAVDQSLEKCAQYIKGAYSFAARKQSSGQIWQEGYHDHHVRNADDFRNQFRYIENNPARKLYEDYPHVHSRYLDRIDPMPDYL